MTSTALEPVTIVQSKAMVLNDANIDTDQIIPARFLTTTSREGLGQYAFVDWRAGQENCALDDERAAGASVIVAGKNFGCGSSREHAAWALADMGVKAVISCEIADIFRSNAVKNGIVPAVIDEAAHEKLLAMPFTQIKVDVPNGVVRAKNEAGDIEASFPLDPFSRLCLTTGTDQMGYILQQEEAITSFEQTHEQQ